MPATFDQYLSQFSAKARYNLKREVKRLRERGQPFELNRYESPGDVPGFLAAADDVIARCWQHDCVKDIVRNTAFWNRNLIDLAEKELLRAYILVSDGQPCAVALGHQFRDVFYLIQTYYDQRLASFSPGRVLTFMYIQDLISYRPVKQLSFGFSDAHYKSFFSNAFSEDVSILLLRKNLANRLTKLSHSSFRSLVNFVKRRVRVENGKS
jgi:CelD/BcsL family acetyltransferase involved in cellulose biosynthesis